MNLRTGSAAVTVIAPADRPLRGAALVPGDKSVSHRAAMVAAMAEGTSVIRGFSGAGDCRATLDVLTGLGARVSRRGDVIEVTGWGPRGPSAPTGALDCRRSGTTMRLMTGILSAAPFRSVLTGHPQLLRRPMARVAEPLRLMGAEVSLSAGGTGPVALEGGSLVGIEYPLLVASAQVKSAVLLAGLRAAGTTSILEPVSTRDHTERLLAWLGVPVERSRAGAAVRTTLWAVVVPPFDLTVPGDISAAAPLLAAGALVPGSEVAVRDVGLNPTRTAFLRILERMGAEVEVTGGVPGTLGLAGAPRLEPLPRPRDEWPEPRGDVIVRAGSLRAVSLGPADVPSLVDELPLVGVLATRAEGVTLVRGATELRVKESDRIAGLVDGLRALGAETEGLPDGFRVRGPTDLQGRRCQPRSDHRLAMAFAVAGLAASGPVEIEDMGCVADSFPGFLDALEALR